MKPERINAENHLQEWLQAGLPQSEEVVANPFVMGGKTFASVEAFAQVIQLPEDDPRREEIASLDMSAAREMKLELKAEGITRPEQVVWEGKAVALGSDEHRSLMREAVRAFERANPDWQDIRPTKQELPRPPQGRRPPKNLPEKSEFVLNVGVDPEVELLSNFAATPFVLEGKEFASVEAFVQYIKYPDGAARKEEIPELAGKYAKRRGKQANRLIEARSHLQGGGFEDIFVFHQGEKIPYRSDEHTQLIARAIEAKFESNIEAREQLAASGDKPLIHNLGYPESRHTSLPANDFCQILMNLRERFSEATEV